MVFRDVTPYHLANQHFGGIFTLKNGGNRFHQNDGNYLPNYTESDSRRPNLNISFVRISNLMLVLLVHLVEYRARCCIVMAGTGNRRRERAIMAGHVCAFQIHPKAHGWMEKQSVSPQSPTLKISRNHTTDYVQSHQFTRLFLGGVFELPIINATFAL
jgi:hypothetical protein